MLQAFCRPSFAQERVVTGTVTAMSTQAPLENVSIQLKGTDVGTVTDAKGKYSINVSSPDDVLVFTCLGFETEEVRVGVEKTVDMLLVESSLNLDEVVVIG